MPGFSNDILNLETNPASVPESLVPVDIIPPVITQEPGRRSSASSSREKDRSRTIQHQYTRRDHRQNQSVDQENKPGGLASLAVAELLLIEVDLGWSHCDWSTRYLIKDLSFEDPLVFNAIEQLRCCQFSCGDLRNVVIRDREDLPVARACFKEKGCCLYQSLVLAVYSPPESLIGSVEESSRICLLSSKFILRNEDGNNVFRIDYHGEFCNSSFTVTSVDNNEEVAKILEKTRGKVHRNSMTQDG